MAGLPKECAMEKLVLILAALSSIGVITFTIAFLILFKDLRHTFKEAHQTLQQAKQFFSHANKTSRQVERVVQKTCGAASMLVDQFFLFKERAQKMFLGHGVWNGFRKS